YIHMIRPRAYSTLFPYTRSSDLVPSTYCCAPEKRTLIPEKSIEFQKLLFGHVLLLKRIIYKVLVLPTLLKGMDEYILCKYLFRLDRKSTRLNSSHVKISYAVLCL